MQEKPKSVNINKNLKKKTKPKRSYLLIDDDPVYLAIMKRAAEMENVQLDCFGSLMELGSIGALTQYNAVIIDYDLGSMTGLEIADYFGKVLHEIPTVLVSSTDRMESSLEWPSSVKRFVKKSDGYGEAIKAAIEVEAMLRK